MKGQGLPLNVIIISIVVIVILFTVIFLLMNQMTTFADMTKEAKNSNEQMDELGSEKSNNEQSNNNINNNNMNLVDSIVFSSNDDGEMVLQVSAKESVSSASIIITTPQGIQDVVSLHEKNDKITSSVTGFSKIFEGIYKPVSKGTYYGRTELIQDNKRILLSKQKLFDHYKKSVVSDIRLLTFKSAPDQIISGNEVIIEGKVKSNVEIEAGFIIRKEDKEWNIESEIIYSQAEDVFIIKSIFEDTILEGIYTVDLIINDSKKLEMMESVTSFNSVRADELKPIRVWSYSFNPSKVHNDDSSLLSARTTLGVSIQYPTRARIIAILTDPQGNMEEYEMELISNPDVFFIQTFVTNFDNLRMPGFHTANFKVITEDGERILQEEAKVEVHGFVHPELLSFTITPNIIEEGQDIIIEARIVSEAQIKEVYTNIDNKKIILDMVYSGESSTYRISYKPVVIGDFPLMISMTDMNNNNFDFGMTRMLNVKAKTPAEEENEKEEKEEEETIEPVIIEGYFLEEDVSVDQTAVLLVKIKSENDVNKVSARITSNNFRQTYDMNRVGRTSDIYTFSVPFKPNQVGNYNAQIIVERQDGTFLMDHTILLNINEAKNSCSSSDECTANTPFCKMLGESFECSRTCASSGEYAKDNKACCAGLILDNGGVCNNQIIEKEFNIVFVPVLISINERDLYYNTARSASNILLSTLPIKECSSYKRDLVIKSHIITDYNCAATCTLTSNNGITDCLNKITRCGNSFIGKYADLIIGLAPPNTPTSYGGGSFAGVATINDPTSINLMHPGYVDGTITHEIGHSLGLHHLGCYTNRYPAGACTGVNSADCINEKTEYIMNYCRPNVLYGPAGYEHIKTRSSLREVMSLCK